MAPAAEQCCRNPHLGHWPKKLGGDQPANLPAAAPIQRGLSCSGEKRRPSSDPWHGAGTGGKATTALPTEPRFPGRCYRCSPLGPAGAWEGKPLFPVLKGKRALGSSGTPRGSWGSPPRLTPTARARGGGSPDITEEGKPHSRYPRPNTQRCPRASRAPAAGPAPSPPQRGSTWRLPPASCSPPCPRAGGCGLAPAVSQRRRTPGSGGPAVGGGPAREVPPERPRPDVSEIAWPDDQGSVCPSVLGTAEAAPQVLRPRLKCSPVLGASTQEGH
ncbi:uncharacterized protein LOC113947463 [Corapipo altera]|uniref:uncharacterized protein LOC113947463 n=1 Tax=Corapipo altera TaxID=415028 RepID=UPI000FD6963F|nr:uncharacterized protein LOC113947463 [Corapipo altera]